MRPTEPNRVGRLRVLKTEDPQSLFLQPTITPQEILARYGPPYSLLSSSAKAEKTERQGILNRVLFLTSGVFCPAATDNCRRLCLGHTSGRMTMESAARARDKRTAFYLAHQDEFLSRLKWELRVVRAEANQRDMLAGVRLNGSSDIPWELLHRDVLEAFPDINFYDYTKLAPRYEGFLQQRTTRGASWPENYHLCFSLSEGADAQSQAERFLSDGGTVAAVFWPKVPADWNGFRVVDGDKHDARFLDPKGVVVGLHAKGTARDDESGFVLRTSNEQDQLRTIGNLLKSTHAA